MTQCVLQIIRIIFLYWDPKFPKVLSWNSASPSESSCNCYMLRMICPISCTALWLPSHWGSTTSWGRMAVSLQKSAELLVHTWLQSARRNAGGLLWSAAEPHCKWRHCKKNGFTLVQLRPIQTTLCSYMHALNMLFFWVVWMIFCICRSPVWWARSLCRNWMACKLSAPFWSPTKSTCRGMQWLW